MKKELFIHVDGDLVVEWRDFGCFFNYESGELTHAILRTEQTEMIFGRVDVVEDDAGRHRFLSELLESREIVPSVTATGQVYFD